MTAFLFSNFAVSTLADDLDNAATTLRLSPADTFRFPVPGAGQAFPLIFGDNFGNVEIVYVTGLVPLTGVCTVMRGQEGTGAKSWAAGTVAQHSLTAETIFSVGGLNPKGNWNSGTTYASGDLVLNNGLTYIATTGGANHEPPNPSYWQLLFNPAGGSGNLLAWKGDWISGATYAATSLVRSEGMLWLALADNMGSKPTRINSNWQAFAQAGYTITLEDPLSTTGTNNYAITTSPAQAAYYNGMMVNVLFANPNTGNVTLNLDGLGAKSAIPGVGGQFPRGAVKPGKIYKFVYLTSADAFLAINYDPNVVQPGTIAAFAGPPANIPVGWANCDGAAISRTGQADLFAAIGTTWGVGDGANTFNLPDFRAKVLMGASATTTAATAVLGAMIGAAVHTLAIGEIPLHGHGMNDPGHGHGQTPHGHSVSDPGHAHPAVVNYYTQYNGFNSDLNNGGGGQSGTLNNTGTGVAYTGVGIQGEFANIGNAFSGTFVSANGGGGSHNNMQPSIGVTWMIKL